MDWFGSDKYTGPVFEAEARKYCLKESIDDDQYCCDYIIFKEEFEWGSGKSLGNRTICTMFTGPDATTYTDQPEEWGWIYTDESMFYVPTLMNYDPDTGVTSVQ